MGFGDLFQKRHQHRKNSLNSSSSGLSSQYQREQLRSPTLAQTQAPSVDPILQYVPDPVQYPNSHQLTKQLVREGQIHWNCCKCGNLGNTFAVRRSDLDPENLVQPFFLWGDSFCNSCSHNFCSTCIERHSF